MMKRKQKSSPEPPIVFLLHNKIPFPKTTGLNLWIIRKTSSQIRVDLHEHRWVNFDGWRGLGRQTQKIREKIGSLVKGKHKWSEDLG
jgi:hypothetical protein